MIDLDALEALANAATPGPWGVYQDRPFDAMQVNHPAGDICELDTWQSRPDEREPDAQLIAASRTAIPALIAEVRALRAGLVEAVSIAEQVDWMAFPNGWKIVDEREARVAALRALAEGSKT